MAVKDLENHHGAVHHLATRLVFKIARLRWRDFVVDQHEIGPPGFGAGHGFCGFTCCDCAVVGDASFRASARALRCRRYDVRYIARFIRLTLHEAPYLLALAGA